MTPPIRKLRRGLTLGASASASAPRRAARLWVFASDDRVSMAQPRNKARTPRMTRDGIECVRGVCDHRAKPRAVSG